MPLSDAAIAAFDQPLVGERLPACRLSDLVASEKMVILHFLRHLGCLFCKHSVDQLYRLHQRTPNLPPIYFVHQSPVARGEQFFEEYFPGAAHISDPQLQLYALFEIARLRPSAQFSPAAILKGFQALFRGHVQYETLGDPNLLSGTFLFFQGRLVWQHRARYAGDDPMWERIAHLPGTNGQASGR